MAPIKLPPRRSSQEGTTAGPSTAANRITKAPSKGKGKNKAQTRRRSSQLSAQTTSGGHHLRIHGFEIGKARILLESRKTLDREYFLVHEIEPGERNTGIYHGIMAIAIKRPLKNGKPDTKNLFIVKVSKRNDKSRAQFKREKNMLSKLSASSGNGREHIISMAGCDTSDRPSWLAMPMLQGPTLTDFLHKEKDGPFPPTLIYSFFLQMCTALSWLHTSTPRKPFQIIHHDLNSGNIILDISDLPSRLPSRNTPHKTLLKYLPKVKIIDFGLAHEQKLQLSYQSRLAVGMDSTLLSVEARSEDYRGDDVDLFACHLFSLFKRNRHREPGTREYWALDKWTEEYNKWFWDIYDSSRYPSDGDIKEVEAHYEPQGDETQKTITEIYHYFKDLPLAGLRDLDFEDATVIFEMLSNAAAALPSEKLIEKHYDEAVFIEEETYSPTFNRARLASYEANDRRLSILEREAEKLKAAKERMKEERQRVRDQKRHVEFEIMQLDLRDWNLIRILHPGTSADSERRRQAAESREDLRERMQKLRTELEGYEKQMSILDRLETASEKKKRLKDERDEGLPDYY